MKFSFYWKEQVEEQNKPIFLHNDACKFINLFGHHIDCLIKTVSKNKKLHNNDEMEELKKDVLIRQNCK